MSDLTHLDDQGRASMVDVSEKAETKRIIKLTDPMPVHITYLTAWTNKDGSMQFRRDLYERDRILSAALSRYDPN